MKRKHTLDAAIHSHAMIVLRLRSDIKLLLSPLFFIIIIIGIHTYTQIQSWTYYYYLGMNIINLTNLILTLFGQTNHKKIVYDYEKGGI